MLYELMLYNEKIISVEHKLKALIKIKINNNNIIID